jgi:hypothetical protein
MGWFSGMRGGNFFFWRTEDRAADGDGVYCVAGERQFGIEQHVELVYEPGHDDCHYTGELYVFGSYWNDERKSHRDDHLHIDGREFHRVYNFNRYYNC